MSYLQIAVVLLAADLILAIEGVGSSTLQVFVAVVAGVLAFIAGGPPALVRRD